VSGCDSDCQSHTTNQFFQTLRRNFVKPQPYSPKDLVQILRASYKTDLAKFTSQKVPVPVHTFFLVLAPRRGTRKTLSHTTPFFAYFFHSVSSSHFVTSCRSKSPLPVCCVHRLIRARSLFPIAPVKQYRHNTVQSQYNHEQQQ
jgi:hypothetical protein